MNFYKLLHLSHALPRIRVGLLALFFLAAGVMSPAYVGANESELYEDEIDVLIASLMHKYQPLIIKEELVDRIIQHGRQYLGRPYKFRNPKGDIMDCSGFMGYIYSLEGIKLPRTSRQQSADCQTISLKDVRRGDLLFFRGTSAKSKVVGHVGMVIEVNGDKLKMLHSSRRGIVIDDYPSTYYSKRFLHAGRVLQLDNKVGEALSAK